MTQLLLEHQHTLEEFARQHGFTYLALFGSYARDEATPDSDVDLLVEYSQGTSLFDVVRMERELSKKLNKKVDLVSRKFLNKYIKPYVQKDLITIYGQG